MRKRPPKRDINNLTDLRVGLYCRVSRDKDDPGDKGKSPDDQEAAGRAWAARVGAVVVEPTYKEKDSRSASRFATKEREEFTRLLADIEAGKLDIIWFWELSRSQRRLDVFADLRDLCRKWGVLLAIGDRVHDPDDYADMLGPSVLSVMGELESEQTSKRVTRGKKSYAHQGNRAGRVPYGYRPVYDPQTGKSVRDEPDWLDGDNPAENSPAAVVIEIYDRLLAGESLTKIRQDLNRRGIRSRTGAQWYNQTIRNMVLSPTYAGLRVHQRDQHDTLEKAILPGDIPVKWPPLVDLDKFWAVYRLLTDPVRKTTRPGRGIHLLSSIARCGECGGKLVRRGRDGGGRHHPREQYFCRDHACAGIDKELLDGYVTERIVGWLSDPDVAASLQPAGDSATAQLARADADRARAELEEWRQLAERGEVTPVTFARVEKAALERIAEAERRIQEAAMPTVLAGNLGPQAQAGWDALDVTVRRQIVTAVASIQVHRIGRNAGGRDGPVHPVYRVGWTWKLGPGKDEYIPPLSYEEQRAESARLAAENRRRKDYVSAERREAITALLRATPELSDREIARHAERVDRHAIRRIRHELEEAGEIPVIRRRGQAPAVNHGYQPRSVT
jgi:site-specific DNA recombinase